MKIYNSLKRGLLVFWISIVTVAAGLASLLFELDKHGVSAQISRARLSITSSCEQLASNLYVMQSLKAPREGQILGDGAAGTPFEAVVDLTLRDFSGVEGGVWQAGTGVIAYAFPTYDGTGIKRDVPSAEVGRIEITARRALQSLKTVLEVRPGIREAVLFSACPVSKSGAGLLAWTLTRVPTVTGEGLKTTQIYVGLLLGFVLFSGAWLGYTLMRWTRGLQQIVKRLHAANGGSEHGVVVTHSLSGLAELDEVAAALNRYSERLGRAHDQATSLAAELVKSERMAALGRLSAGLAHEIRNPLGTIRMKVENALAAPARTRQDRSESALQVVLEQSARLEALISSLLALTQPLRLHYAPVSLAEWLSSICEFYAEHASHQGVRIELSISPALTDINHDLTLFDPIVLRRALDNLMLNALAYVGHGGKIELGAVKANSALLLWVQDDGPGVPDELRSRLFEPFITGRKGGSGLGLAFVQEAVIAHSGTVTLAPTDRGARFEVELPWLVF